MGVILVLGRVVVRPMFRFVGSAGSREIFLAAVLLVIIGTAIATEEAGLSNVAVSVWMRVSPKPTTVSGRLAITRTGTGSPPAGV